MRNKNRVTVKELIDVLKGFNKDAIIVREEKDFSSDYELKTVAMYGTDSEHVFLEFDE